jgi:hypothetical protein
MKRIQVKMPDNIFHTLTLKAASLGTNNSAYIRALILDQEILSADKNEEQSRLIGEVAKFGNNLNQIAHVLNISNLAGTLDDVNYQALLDQLYLLEKAIESILKNSTPNDTKSNLNA